MLEEENHVLASQVTKFFFRSDWRSSSVYNVKKGRLHDLENLNQSKACKLVEKAILQVDSHACKLKIKSSKVRNTNYESKIHNIFFQKKRFIMVISLYLW